MDVIIRSKQDVIISLIIHTSLEKNMNCAALLLLLWGYISVLPAVALLNSGLTSFMIKNSHFAHIIND